MKKCIWLSGTCNVARADSIESQLLISVSLVSILSPGIALYIQIANVRIKLIPNILLQISLIIHITPIQEKLQTVCNTAHIPLIFPSTFCFATPNKLPALPAVKPDIKSPTANTASNARPTGFDFNVEEVKNPDIFLLNLATILSALFNIFANILSHLEANLAIFGNFSASFPLNNSKACLATPINLLTVVTAFSFPALATVATFFVPPFTASATAPTGLANPFLADLPIE